MDNRQIVEECKLGNTKAMDYLYRKYFNKMLHIVYANISDKTYAHDILHDGFIVIFSHISELKNPDKLEAWMDRIMRNISAKTLCSDKKPIFEQEYEFETEIESIEDVLSYEEMVGLIDNLPKGYAQIFKLSFFENKSHLEISQLLGIAPHSSSSQLHRAKSLLRKMIGKLLEEKGYWCIIFISISFPLAYFLFLMNKSDEMIKVLRPISNYVSNTDAYNATKECRNEQNNPYKVAKECDNEQRNIDFGNSEINNKKEFEIPTLEVNESIFKEDEIFVDENHEEHDKNEYSGELIQEDKNCQESFSIELNRKSLEKKRVENINQLPSSGSEVYFSLSFENGFNRSLKTFHKGVEDYTCSTTLMDSTVAYKRPISFSLLANYRLGYNFYIESGLTYSRRQTEENVNSLFGNQSKKCDANFVGLPLKVKYNLYGIRKFDVYSSLGIIADFPVKILVKENTNREEGYFKYEKRLPVQWSLNGSIGVEYHISHSVGLFVEPSFLYHINSHERTLLYPNRYEFTLPIGVRWTW